MADAAMLADLVARAQDGDTRAFESLIGEHLPQVRRFAQAFAHNEDDAADLAQEALIKVYRSIRSYRFQSAFSTWLYAVVRNAFLDVAKSRAGKERAAERPLERSHVEDRSPQPTAEERLAQEQERRRVWAALAEVPVEFRTVLVLFDIEGLAYDEVAAIEKVPLGTVKSRLHRGRDHLRRLLGAPAQVADPARDPGGNPEGSRVVSPEERAGSR